MSQTLLRNLLKIAVVKTDFSINIVPTEMTSLGLARSGGDELQLAFANSGRSSAVLRGYFWLLCTGRVR